MKNDDVVLESNLHSYRTHGDEDIWGAIVMLVYRVSRTSVELSKNLPSESKSNPPPKPSRQISRWRTKHSDHSSSTAALHDSQAIDVYLEFHTVPRPRTRTRSPPRFLLPINTCVKKFIQFLLPLPLPAVSRSRCLSILVLCIDFSHCDEYKVKNGSREQNKKRCKIPVI